MIERRITTFWFSPDNTIPTNIQKCIDSQKAIEGYSHQLLTLDDIKANTELYNSRYVQECLNNPFGNKKWVKLADFCRMFYLYNYGGIVLDADVEIIKGKNFDQFLNEQMFIGKELDEPQRGVVVLGVAVIGVHPKHPLILKWMHEVQLKFRGDDEHCYESSMQILNIVGVDYQDQMTLIPPDYFYPYDHYTDSLNITNNTIAIHQFNRAWIERTFLQDLKDKIQTGTNYVFIKRGDGEIACMQGVVGANCDGHKYSEELGQKLIESYSYLEGQKNINGKDINIVEFDDQTNYNVLLHRVDSNLHDVGNFYKTIANSKRKKVIIAPEKLGKMARILGAEHIVIPELNVWDSFGKIFNEIPVYDNGIYLFCAGMPAKVMIAWLYAVNNNATYLDCGSAFDPMIGETRTFQIDRDTFNNLYKKDNYKLPQETHPERLYVINNIPNIESNYIIDLGCGTNKTIPTAVGMDIRPVSDITGSIDTVPFTDATFDAIISRHSLEHMLDPFKCLKEWNRILKLGGRMVIVLPDHEFINTLDWFWSKGEHLHCYTREVMRNFISLFPDLLVLKSDIVLDDWSFGTVIYKLPKISFIIPHLGREAGLKKCEESIFQLDYPKELIDIVVMNGDQTVPQKVKRGLEMVTGDYIIYAANDMTFDPQCIKNALKAAQTKNKGLVSFNEGELLPDKGNICTHFIIDRKLIDKLDNKEIFSTDFYHTGVDNYLWKQCEKLGEAYWCEEAKITHDHFSKGAEYDDVYRKGWSNVDKDRATLKRKLDDL